MLVVDQGPQVCDAIRRVLEVEGAETVRVDPGEAALALLERSEFDLVILDVGLSAVSGFEMLRRVWEHGDIPVMMVTGSGSLAEWITGFDLGADDYVQQPIEEAELSRRACALLRRTRSTRGRAAEELKGAGGLVLRMRSHEALVDGAVLDLTPKEFAVLRLLLERRCKVVSPNDLSLAIWSYETFGSRNFVEAHISRSRSKLARGPAGQIMKTIRGVGYVIR
ncbi:MAG: response regulator transcription factor [Dehalococcoidia bacterium]|nr:response regulator transcription factor [Dehalococcoidia bacterium]